jgi:hypothetical protein
VTADGRDPWRDPRVVALERVFGLELSDREAARCTSLEATTAVLAGRLHAAAEGPRLSPIALGAVREALRELRGTDRETVLGATSLDGLLPLDGRTTCWNALGAHLRCDLPPVRAFCLPRGMETVGGLVAWIVATAPAQLRPGTEWSRGQIAEVVEAVRRMHDCA